MPQTKIQSRQIEGGSGGGNQGPAALPSYSGWDVYIEPIDGVYTAYSRSGTTLGSSAILATIFDEVKAEGKHIHFAPGSYTTATSLEVMTRMRVSGEGYATLITKTGAGAGIRSVGTSGSQLEGVLIEDIRLVGPSIGTAQVAGSGVLVEENIRTTVQRCWITGFGSLGDDAGIEIDSSSRIHVLNNKLWGNKNGVCTGSPGSTTIRVTDSLVADNECYQNYDDGIHLQRGMRNVVRNNNCWGHPVTGGASDGAGIDTLGEEYSLVVGNHCHANARGLEIGNTANQAYGDIANVYLSNTIVYNTIYGVTVIASAKRNRLTSNVIENNPIGIRFGSATAGAAIDDNVIENNHIHNNGTYGIDMFGYVTRSLIQSNYMSGHTSADVYVRTSTGTPAGYAILNNRLRSTTQITDNVNAVDKNVSGNFV